MLSGRRLYGGGSVRRCQWGWCCWPQGACPTAEAGCSGVYQLRKPGWGFRVPRLLPSIPTGLPWWAAGQAKPRPRVHRRRPAACQGSSAPTWARCHPKSGASLFRIRGGPWRRIQTLLPNSLEMRCSTAWVKSTQGHIFPKVTHSPVFCFYLRFHLAPLFDFV